MSINIRTTGVHHVSLRVSDLPRAKRFYTETLGFPVIAEMPDLVLFLAGGTAFGLRAPSNQMPTGDKLNRVGVLHGVREGDGVRGHDGNVMQFGVTRMYQTLNDHPQITTGIFRDRDAAFAWIAT